MAGTLTLRNAMIFDGESPALLEGSLQITDGVITGVGPDVADAGEVLDARGRTVIPGLIDAHFHAYGTSFNLVEIEAGKLSYLALAGPRLRSALCRGFSTVRDVAGGDGGLAQGIRAGLIRSPRYLYTGPALSQTGGHGDPRSAELDLCGCGAHMCEVVDGVDAVRRVVRDRFRTGAHAIKIMTSGGVVSPTDPIRVPQYSPEAIQHSISNGVRCIEHANLLDVETAKLMAELDVFLVPTLVTYDAMAHRGPQLGLPPHAQAKNREVLADGRKAIELARDAGVRIGFGTDLMGPLEDEQLNGLQLQAEVLGVLDTLRSATSTNADLLRRDDLGRIREGAVGDVVVLAGNPFSDASVLWTESEDRVVVQAGSVIL